MNRTFMPDPELGTFEITKNSTFGGGDSGFSGSRNDSNSNSRNNETGISIYSSISGGASIRLGML